MWPDSKRAVDVKTAAAIAAVARDSGATPVGVFVSENAGAIADACEAARLPVAQLHGDGARAAMLLLPSTLQASTCVPAIALLPAWCSAQVMGSGCLRGPAPRQN